jgi:hypothetical protein
VRLAFVPRNGGTTGSLIRWCCRLAACVALTTENSTLPGLGHRCQALVIGDKSLVDLALMPRRVQDRKSQTGRIRLVSASGPPHWLYCAAGPESPEASLRTPKTTPPTTSAADLAGFSVI